MLDNIKGMSGKGKQAILIMYIVASAGFIFIKDIAVPLADKMGGNRDSTPSLAQQVAINTKRLDIIEAFNIGISAKIDALLQGSATREEAINNLKTTLDRVEKRQESIEGKLDRHMVIAK